MSGYTVTNSIDLIDEYCENPSRYKSWQLKMQELVMNMGMQVALGMNL